MAVNKESYYMVIPSKIWDSKLDAKSILMYGHITVLANKGGFCYANNKYFERVLDISTSTVVRKLNELESLNFIKRSIIYDDDNKTVKERRIYLNTGSIMDEHRPIITDENRAIVTSEQDNTTRNNNSSYNNDNTMSTFGKNEKENDRLLSATLPSGITTATANIVKKRYEITRKEKEAKLYSFDELAKLTDEISDALRINGGNLPLDEMNPNDPDNVTTSNTSASISISAPSHVIKVVEEDVGGRQRDEPRDLSR